MVGSMEVAARRGGSEERWNGGCQRSKVEAETLTRPETEPLGAPASSESR